MPVISDGTLVNLVSVRLLFSVDTRLPNAAKTLPQSRSHAAGLRRVRPGRNRPPHVDKCVPRRLAAEWRDLLDVDGIGDPGRWLDLLCGERVRGPVK
jgi:hypothetical protein